MADVRCECGFSPAAGEIILDHFLEVFVPEDGTGSDGRVHEEGDPPGTCRCGEFFGHPGELDAHFIAEFLPADMVGLDGMVHKVATGGLGSDCGYESAGGYVR
jgi:hypothetical protein